jgi:hypothetical protein
MIDIREGDTVTYQPPDMRLECQGMVMGIGPGEEEDGDMVTVCCYRRGHKDIVNKRMKAYHYFMTDEIYTFPLSYVKARIPCQIVSKKDATAKTLSDLVDSKYLTQGIIYISESLSEDGVLSPCVSELLLLQWYHFNASSIENVDEFEMDPHDLASGLLCVIKQLLFDPFVSADSTSRRKANQLHWNPKSWKLLLKAALGHISAEECKRKIHQLAFEPKMREVFYNTDQFLRLIIPILHQWVHCSYDDFSIQDALLYLRNHEDIMNDCLEKFDETLLKHESDEDEIDELLGQEEEEEKEEDEDGSYNGYSSSDEEEEEIEKEEGSSEDEEPAFDSDEDETTEDTLSDLCSTTSESSASSSS